MWGVALHSGGSLLERRLRGEHPPEAGGGVVLMELSVLLPWCL